MRDRRPCSGLVRNCVPPWRTGNDVKVHPRGRPGGRRPPFSKQSCLVQDNPLDRGRPHWRNCLPLDDTECSPGVANVSLAARPLSRLLSSSVFSPQLRSTSGGPLAPAFYSYACRVGDSLTTFSEVVSWKFCKKRSIDYIKVIGFFFVQRITIQVRI